MAALACVDEVSAQFWQTSSATPLYEVQNPGVYLEPAAGDRSCLFFGSSRFLQWETVCIKWPVILKADMSFIILWLWSVRYRPDVRD